MSRRICRIAAVAALAVLSTGCVTQSLPEGALEDRSEDLGVAAAPLHVGEARRVVLDDHRAPVQRQPIRVTAAEASEAPSERVGLVRDASDRRGVVETPASEPDKAPAATPERRPRAEPGTGAERGTGSEQGTGSATPRGANRPRGDRSGADRTDGDDKGAQPAPATPTPPAPAYRTAADVSDPEGDRGRAPAYADLRRVLIESDGANARVSIVVAGRLPATLAEGEVQGIGVDFYRTNDRESDYQLFADGGSTGWEAYLHTPSGIGRFEGSFRMGGQMLVFEVPWSSLGGRKAADVSAFVDWSAQDRPFNRTGGDRAPDQGRFRVLP